MKTYIKWRNLTNGQRNSIKSFYQEEIDKRELFEHDLNKRSFLINITDGNFIARKDF